MRHSLFLHFRLISRQSWSNWRTVTKGTLCSSETNFTRLPCVIIACYPQPPKPSPLFFQLCHHHSSFCVSLTVLWSVTWSHKAEIHNRLFWPEPIYWDTNFVLKCLPAQCVNLIIWRECLFLTVRV